MDDDHIPIAAEATCPVCGNRFVYEDDPEIVGIYCTCGALVVVGDSIVDDVIAFFSEAKQTTQ